MSDDEHNDDEEDEVEQPQGPFVHTFHPAMFRPPTPDEIERQQMAMTANQHETYRLFGELPLDGLRSLRQMLHVITCNSDTPNAAAEHFEGVATGVLYGKYNICISCGVDHDNELKEMTTDGTEPDDGSGSSES